MITILHGDDILASREALNSKRQESKESLTFDAKNLTIETLKQEIEGRLFNTKRTIIIENLLTFPQKELTSYLSSQDGDFILWEAKEIGTKTLSDFKQADIQNFKLKKALFTFLDNVKPGNNKAAILLFHESLKTTEQELIFFMLVRHFRLMLAVSSGAKITERKNLAPWQEGKLAKQATLFGQENLKDLYNKLFKIETSLKTGGSLLNLAQQIDFFLLGI